MKYKFPIETARLEMRVLTPNDLEAWSVFFVDNPQLHYVGVTEKAPPLEHAKTWMDRQLARYDEYGLGMLAMIEKTSGQLIGQVGIIQRDINDELYHEVGYAVIPSKWGQGFATEAAIRMKEYILEHKIDTRVISMIHVDNIGSQTVATKNGMHRAFEWNLKGDPCYIYQQDLA